MRQTHTFATLEVSESTFEEIKQLLLAAEYRDAFINEGQIIDMKGIGLKKSLVQKVTEQKWRCRRCEQIVDMKEKKCGCTVSPSPWEPI